MRVRSNKSIRLAKLMQKDKQNIISAYTNFKNISFYHLTYLNASSQGLKEILKNKQQSV